MDDISTDNKFEIDVLSAVDTILKSKYSNIEKSFSRRVYYYKKHDKIIFSLSFLKSNNSYKAVFSTNYVGEGYNLQINEKYEYCGNETKISKQVIEDIKSKNGNLLNIIEKILKYMI